MVLSCLWASHCPPILTSPSHIQSPEPAPRPDSTMCLIGQRPCSHLSPALVMEYSLLLIINYRHMKNGILWGLHIPITNFSGVKLGLALATPHLLVPIIPEESEASLGIYSLYPYLLPASKRQDCTHLTQAHSIVHDSISIYMPRCLTALSMCSDRFHVRFIAHNRSS